VRHTRRIDRQLGHSPTPHGYLARRFSLRNAIAQAPPAFTLVVTITMAIAIGATTTMMSVVNAAIIRPLPFPGAERLVFARGFLAREQSLRGISYLEARDWRAKSRASRVAPHAALKGD
jgi:hypothetical protein